ncbi:ATP-binding protein [Isoptericola aurantiacus]|uniref:ATP-binding protein n=1 Tax=Isoptericola aurantiacus TaxID=3377839 RepID=UPI00383A61D6
MTPSPGAPTAARLVRSWTFHDADALACVRGHLQETLRGSTEPWCGCSAEDTVLQDIVLVASELAANALEHAGTTARLELWCDGTTALISVTDRLPSVPPVLSPDRELGEGGFGLQLALRVADDVGWYRTAGEKHVWARFTPRDSRPVDPTL